MPQKCKPQPLHNPHEKILVSEAARRCGWRRANTFRERFLSCEEDALAMGLAYDADDRAVVDADAVDERVRQVEEERASRPPGWRLRNLGDHARPRPARRRSAVERATEDETRSRPKKG